MPSRNSRRAQQRMNQYRRDRPWRMADLLGTPVYMGNGAWYIPPDPEREREEFVRQLTARRDVAEGESVMAAEVGRWDGMSIISTSPEALRAYSNAISEKARTARRTGNTL